MSRVLPDTIVDALDDNVIYPFFAVEMNFDSDNVLRLWTGVGTLTKRLPIFLTPCVSIVV